MPEVLERMSEVLERMPNVRKSCNFYGYGLWSIGKSIELNFKDKIVSLREWDGEISAELSLC